MVKAWHSVVVLLAVWSTGQALFSTAAGSQLSPTFYAKTCPDVFKIVGKGVWSAIQSESRIAASLLRLHFHDCFVQGCDGSILLDNTTSLVSEFYSLPNQNSVRGFGTIDTLKAALEKTCPGVVSCADIVALASFFSVVLSGGPVWPIPLGRRDSFTSAINLTTNLPGPSFTISQLKTKFNDQKLTSTDLVALSGGHTIGFSRCATLQTRLYNFNGTGNSDPSINPSLLKALDKTCPQGGNGNVTTPLDIQTVKVFDNLYYINIINGNGIFSSDVELLTSASDTAKLVQLYAANETKFFIDFATSMIKMGNLNVLTGKAGEVRKNCHVRNPVKDIIEEEESSEVVIEEEERSIFKGAEEDIERGDDRSETPFEKLIESAEKVLEGAADFLKDVVEKVKEDIVRDQLRKMTVEDTTGGEHSSI